MSQREKLLGMLVGGLVALFGLVLIYTMVRDGLEAKRQQISHLQDEITTATTKNTLAKQASERAFQYQKRSLPADDQFGAQVAYDRWLRIQVDKAGLEKAKISAERIRLGVRNERPYTELRYTLRGNADVQTLTRFLYAFYSTDKLHRIRHLNIVPQRDSRKLSLVMGIDALSMPELDPRRLQERSEAKLSPEQLAEMARKHPMGTISEDRLPFSLAEYESQIIERNLFAPANQPPEIESIAGQETRIGETLQVSLEATDPEGDEVTFELGPDAPEDARISASGEFSYRPREEGRFTVTIRATDKGVPPKPAEPRTMTIVVAAQEESPGAFEGIDKSQLAVLTGFVQGRLDRGPMIWMHLRSDDEVQYLAKGDKIQIGTWEGVVKSVDLRKSRAVIGTEEGEFLLRLGETLADAQFIEAEDGDEATDARNTDVVPTSAERRRTEN